MAASDTGKASAALDFETHLFINPDLTVHLSRAAWGMGAAGVSQRDRADGIKPGDVDAVRPGGLIGVWRSRCSWPR
jgi:hypothetical protein